MSSRVGENERLTWRADHCIRLTEIEQDDLDLNEWSDDKWIRFCTEENDNQYIFDHILEMLAEDAEEFE